MKNTSKFCYDYPRPMVTVDCIIHSKVDNQHQILLIKRAKNPFQNHWALPGGFVDLDEDLDEAIIREVEEETNIKAKKIKQLLTIGTPGRDPRGRTISIIYYTKINKQESLLAKAGDDAKELMWHNINSIPDLAFDHNFIVAVWLKKQKLTLTNKV